MMFGRLKSPIRAYLRLLLLALWMLLWYLPFQIAYRTNAPFHGLTVRLFSRGMMAICGVKIIVHGKMSRKRPILFAANHASYYDIFGLASVLPAVFIAKDEIPGWPVVGPLTKLAGTVYISRKVMKMSENMQELKKSGKQSFILFPEGTTTDGNRAKKFSSAFFEMVKALSDKPMTVQPVSIAYTRISNIPMGNHHRPYFAWFGDMDLATHVPEALAFSSITMEITFHPECAPEMFDDRKALAAHCEEVVGSEVSDLLSRRKHVKFAA